MECRERQTETDRERERQRERQIHRYTDKKRQRQRWPLILAYIMYTPSLAQLLQYIFAEITGMLNTVYVTRTLSCWSSSFSIKVTYFSCLSPVAMWDNCGTVVHLSSRSYHWSLFQRNGADFSVFVNTGQEFDGSDSGARPDEAVSWGKIKLGATPVKVTFC